MLQFLARRAAEQRPSVYDNSAANWADAARQDWESLQQAGRNVMANTQAAAQANQASLLPQPSSNANWLQRALYNATAHQANAGVHQANLAQGALGAGLQAMEENTDAVESWTRPIDGISRLIGSAVAGQNPFVDGHLEGPLLSEALLERGVNPALANLAEFLVPDPTGAKRIRDLMPLLGFVPFMRTLRERPNLAGRVVTAIDSPGGVWGMWQDLADAFPGSRISADGNSITLYGGRGLQPGVASAISDAPAGTTSQMTISRYDLDSLYIDMIVGSESDGNAVRDLLLPVLDFADAHGVTLRGSAHGFTDRMSTEELMDIYTRLGFEPDNGPGWLGQRSVEVTRRPVPLDDHQRTEELERRLRHSQGVQAPGLNAEDTATLDEWLWSEGYSRSEIADYHEQLAYEFAGRDWDDIRGEMELRMPLLDEPQWDAIADDVYVLSRSPLAEGADGFIPPALEDAYRATGLSRDELATMLRAAKPDDELASRMLSSLGIEDESLHASVLADLGYQPPPPPVPAPERSGRPPILFNSENPGSAPPTPEGVAGASALAGFPEGAMARGVDDWQSAMASARADGDARYDHLRSHFRDNPASFSGRFEGSATPDELLGLSGGVGEHTRIAAGTNPEDARKIQELTASMRERGYDRSLGQPIFIWVDADGVATIAEGNHRIRAAKEAGLEYVPIEVHYFGGSDGNPDAWRPIALQSYLGLE